MTDLQLEAGRVVLRARCAIGWSQRELSRRSNVSQSAISRLERGLPSGIGLDGLARIADALGGAFHLTFDAPYLVDRARQREAVHARCIAYVAAHLRRLDWIVETEVEIDGRNGPGWIDVLAFHPASGALLVIEIKTEIHDIGRIQRTLAWYERRAWPAARSRRWRVRGTHAALLLLATDAVEARLRENRATVDEVFNGRATGLAAFVNDPIRDPLTNRSMAMIDPFSRRQNWLRPTRLDGRRSRAPHEDYAAAARRLSTVGRARAHESRATHSAASRAP